MAPFSREVAEAVAEVLKLLYERRLVQVTGGNVSALQEGLVYITPTGLPRHRLTWRDIAVIGLDGRVFRGRPSSEWRMHVEIYKRLSGRGVSAVVHAHPPRVLAAVEAGLRLDASLFTEAKLRLGCVALVPRLEPGTWELARAAASALESSGCRAVVLAGHGAVTVAGDLWRALDAMESLEDLAEIALASALAGRGEDLWRLGSEGEARVSRGSG